MTIADTIADGALRRQGEDGLRLRQLMNAEALALEQDGVDVVQFDEPAFNVFHGRGDATGASPRWSGPPRA